MENLAKRRERAGENSDGETGIGPKQHLHGGPNERNGNKPIEENAHRKLYVKYESIYNME